LDSQQVKKTQLSESSVKQKEVSNTRGFVEEEQKDEEDGWQNILDPLSKTCKGRPRKKNKIKPANRRNLTMMAMSLLTMQPKISQNNSHKLKWVMEFSLKRVVV